MSTPSCFPEPAHPHHEAARAYREKAEAYLRWTSVTVIGEDAVVTVGNPAGHEPPRVNEERPLARNAS